MSLPRPVDPSEAGFLAAIATNPADDTARLAYADWLDDRGDPRAALVRLEVATRQPPPAHVRDRDRLRRLYAGTWADAVRVEEPPALSDLPAHPVEGDGYTQSFSRANPGCVLFLVGHGGWLREPACGGPRTWGEVVGHLVNRELSEILMSCEKGEDLPRDLFAVGVMGYGSGGAGPALSGNLAGRPLVSLPDLYSNPLAIERRQKTEYVDDGAGGLREVADEIAVPVWYRPPAPAADAPMCAGLDAARRTLERWVAENPDGHPPVVIHFTDGTVTDGDPEPPGVALRGVRTRDGATLVFTVCASPGHDRTACFPWDERQLFTPAERLAFRLSSELPPPLRWALSVRGEGATPGARGLAVNHTRVVPFVRLPWGGPSYPLLPPHLR